MATAPRRSEGTGKHIKNNEIRIIGDFAYVPLTKGLEAVIDAVDVPIVQELPWYAKTKKNATSYAESRVNVHGCMVGVLMHRLINATPNDKDTDHIDGNGLNNTRANLRNASKSQNMHNAKKRIDNSSGVKGVSWNKVRNKWQVRIRLHGKQHHVGMYSNLDEASSAYSSAAASKHGEFASGR